MKIGIITFHWGTNYGGVLQAYALQTFLESKGHEVCIINYAPVTFRDSRLRCFRSKSLSTIRKNLTEFDKDQNIEKFRAKRLNRSRRYYKLDELKAEPPSCDMFICGSDQVWNHGIVRAHGLAYYLPFGAQDTIRVSYAVSLGSTEYPAATMEKVRPYIERFDKISVRENTGKKILEEAGFDQVDIMPDPTLLLSNEDYEQLMPEVAPETSPFAFFYVLQRAQFVIMNLENYFRENGNLKVINNKASEYGKFGIEHWLFYMKNAEVVVTNSFHGLVFSLMFKKNFVVVPIEGVQAGMNDRIHTLLDKFGLKKRIVSEFNVDTVKSLLNDPIDWASVDVQRQSLKASAEEFFREFESKDS